MGIRGAKRAVLAGACLMALALAGCGTGDELAPGTCLIAEDCLTQQVYGPVCYQGLCVECAAEQDCLTGFTCTGNTCVAATP